MEELRQRVAEEWDSLGQTVIDCAMKYWRKNCEDALHLTRDTSYMHREPDMGQLHLCQLQLNYNCIWFYQLQLQLQLQNYQLQLQLQLLVQLI